MPRRSPLIVPSASAQNRGPQYRFWGSQKPPASREPIRAQVNPSDDGEGTATIRIYAPIDDWGGIWGVSAQEFADALDALDDSVSTIALHLNSPGGQVYEGIAILNLLRQHPANVVATVDSLAASAASFIACGADELVMSENSQLMIHDAWGICIGPADDMHQTGNLLDKISANIAGVYEAKAGNGTDWRAAMLAETWYNADEAVAAGLADRVDSADEPDEDDTTASNKAVLAQFRHQGRADAPAPPTAKKPPQADADLPAPNCLDEGAQMSALQDRRHRMNARRHSLPL